MTYDSDPSNPSPLDTAHADEDHVLVRNFSKKNPPVQDLKILSVSDPEMRKNSEMPPPPPYKNREKNYMTEEGESKSFFSYSI